MTENTLQDQISTLGSDTIMGTMSSMNKEELENLNDAIEERKEPESVAISGDTLEAMAKAGYFRKTRPIVRDNPKVGRNDPCPCGALDKNGKPKKYKNCCMNSGSYETTHYN